MSRRKTPIPDTTPLLQELGRLATSPLQAIGDILRKDLVDTEASTRAGYTAGSDFVLLYERTREVIASLPSTFGQRFLFDSAMIQSMTEAWSKIVILPAMIIPKPGTGWAVHGTAISDGKDNAQRLFFMMIPNTESIDDVDLRTYAFMCHELAHVVMFMDDSIFVSRFEVELDKCLQKMRLRTAADKGSARNKAKSAVDAIERLWRPTANHQNWVHELAIDVMAVWTLGPAYVDTYLAALNISNIRPYEIVQSHPPHAVRVQALLQAARKLGWETRSLTDQLAIWLRSSRPSNHYAGAADQELIVAGVGAALSTCELLDLPKCTKEQLEAVEALVRRKDVPSFGVEAIWASWIMASSSDYEDWESETICRMATFIQ